MAPLGSDRAPARTAARQCLGPLCVRRMQQQSALWTCQFAGCRSSPDQVAALRSRKPQGFPHDEDPHLRVCTVCRRLPLALASAAANGAGRRAEVAIMEDEPLDAAFLEGIKEELSSVEESEKNIQALSQVLRYHAKHAKQLSQVLCDWAKQCFPWELIHAMHLLDDILLMDNSGRFKAELAERVQALVVTTFRKVPSEPEKREVVRMVHAWQGLKIFDLALLEAIRSAIGSSGLVGQRILDEVTAAGEEDEDAPDPLKPTPAEGRPGGPASKKQKVDEPGNIRASTPVAAPVEASTPRRNISERAVAMVDRILATPLDKPLEMLCLEEGAEGHDIRKAYRRMALVIHPDKNPGLETRCQDALIRLQQGREQAESDLQRLDIGNSARNETRSEAVVASANASVDSGFKCKYPGCDLPPCKQCANQCCTRNITHCHNIARASNSIQCFFHPPPRAWARNA